MEEACFLVGTGAVGTQDHLGSGHAAVGPAEARAVCMPQWALQRGTLQSFGVVLPITNSTTVYTPVSETICVAETKGLDYLPYGFGR